MDWVALIRLQQEERAAGWWPCTKRRNKMQMKFDKLAAKIDFLISAVKAIENKLAAMEESDAIDIKALEDKFGPDFDPSANG